MDLCWQCNVSAFYMLSRLVITFLPRSKRLLISWLQSPTSVILEPPKNKVCHCFHCFPIYLPGSDESNGTPLQYSCLENPWVEEPGRLQSMGSVRVRPDWATSLWLFTFMHWRRKWQPTPVFLPENPRDGGAWWAAISGVTQNRTRLKWLSSSSRSRWDQKPWS